jgi:hypothetical protein
MLERHYLRALSYVTTLKLLIRFPVTCS